MKINTQILKKACQEIAQAIDTKKNTVYANALQIEVKDGVLLLSTTNREYYVELKVEVECEDSFKATVQAQKFIQLMSKLTSENIELTTDGLNLVIAANGEYKIPLVYLDDKMLEIPVIEIKNKIADVKLTQEILQGIMTNTSRELKTLSGISPVQSKNYYHITKDGAITYNLGVSYSKFELDEDVRIALSQKVVSLFKLLKDNEVEMIVGKDLEGEEEINKVKFITKNCIISSLAPSTKVMDSVPMAAITKMISQNYPSVVKVNCAELISAIDRLLVFCDSDFYCGILNFSPLNVTISNSQKTCIENISLEEIENAMSTTAAINLKRLRTTLENSEYVEIGYGDARTVCVKTDASVDIIPRITI